MQNRARTRLCCGQLLLKTQFIIISLIAARLIGSINSLLVLLLLHQKATKFVEFFCVFHLSDGKNAVKCFSTQMMREIKPAQGHLSDDFILSAAMEN